MKKTENENPFLLRKELIESSESYFQTNMNYFLKQNNMTHKDLAEKVGIAEKTITSYMRTKDPRFPNRTNLDSIADAFGVTSESMITANLDMMISDQRLAKIVIDENLIQYAKEHSDTKHKFEALMCEIGYTNVIAFINYLQFTGYQLTYYSYVNEKRTISNKPESDKVKLNLNKQKADLTPKLSICQKRLAELKKINLKYEPIKEGESEEEFCQREEIRLKLVEERDLLALDESFYKDQLDKLNDDSFIAQVITHEVNFKEIFNILNNIKTSSKSNIMFQLQKLYIMVYIQSSINDTLYKIKFEDFYKMCVSFNESILGKIISLDSNN